MPKNHTDGPPEWSGGVAAAAEAMLTRMTAVRDNPAEWLLTLAGDDEASIRPLRGGMSKNHIDGSPELSQTQVAGRAA